jgi:hypothetical protein
MNGNSLSKRKYLREKQLHIPTALKNKWYFTEEAIHFMRDNDMNDIGRVEGWIGETEDSYTNEVLKLMKNDELRIALERIRFRLMILNNDSDQGIAFRERKGSKVSFGLWKLL